MYREILTKNNDESKKGNTMCNDEMDMKFKESNDTGRFTQPPHTADVVLPDQTGDTLKEPERFMQPPGTAYENFPCDPEGPDDEGPDPGAECSPDQIHLLPIPPHHLTGGVITEEHIAPPEAGIPDSGERRKFTTGSIREIREGKGRYDLISPFALKALAKRLEDGMKKYSERNWEKGQPLMSYLDSALRHINDYITDCMMAKLHAEDHMGAAMWNLHGFIHTLAMVDQGLLPEELDDRPFPSSVGIDYEKSSTKK